MPLPNSELTWFMDGSNFVKNEVGRAGAAVADHHGEVVWSCVLPPVTSAQKAELIALFEALKELKGGM